MIGLENYNTVKEYEELKVKTEKLIDGKLLKKDGGQVIEIVDLYPKVTTNLINTLAKDLSKKHDCLILSLIANCEKDVEVIGEIAVKKIMMLEHTTKTFEDGNLSHYYKTFANYTGKDLTGNCITKEYRLYLAMVDKLPFSLLVKKEIELEQDRYQIRGLGFDRPVGKSMYLDEHILAFKANKIVEKYKNFKLKSLQQLSTLYDVETKKSRLTDDEIYIFWSIFGYKLWEIGVNLIIIGETQIGKSTAMEILAEALDEEVISGSMSTGKGLVVSFFGDTPDPGALCQARYVAPINEFFGFLMVSGLNKTQKEIALSDELKRYKEVFERRPTKVVCGKYSYAYHFKKALLATTNTDVIDEYMNWIWKNNAAGLQRFTFLNLPLEKAEHWRTPIEYREIYFKEYTSKEFLKNFVLYLLQEKDKVIFDRKILNEIKKRTDTTGYLYQKEVSLIRVIVLINRMIENRTDYKARENDYKILETCLMRLDFDFTDLLGSEYKKKQKEEVK